MIFFVVALVLVPVMELAVIIWVGQWLGVWETIALLLMCSVLGVWLVKRQGTSALTRIRTELAVGRVPAAALIDGMLIFTAGVLFLVPGFVTDVVAVLLLIGPVRGLARGSLGRRFRVRAAIHTTGDRWPAPPPRPPSSSGGMPQIEQ